MKVYIAGSITNNPNYINDFAEAELFFKERGHAVINPIKNLGFDYKDYIDMGLCELMKCDAICFIENTDNSKGTNLEMMYAMVTGMKIFHYEDVKENGFRL